MKLTLLLLLLAITVSHGAKEVTWSHRVTADSRDGVTLEYQFKEHESKQGRKTAVRWAARNNNGYPVDIEIIKTYKSSIDPAKNDVVTPRTEKKANLGAGKVYDPSPDYILGNAHTIAGSLRVTRKSDSKAAEAKKADATQSPDADVAPVKPTTPPREPAAELAAQLKQHKERLAAFKASQAERDSQRKPNPAANEANETAELKKAVPAASGKRQLPATPQTEGDPQRGVRTGVHTVSKPGHGPFDDDGETVYGWTRAVNHQTKKMIIGQIYQFKGEGPARTSDRWESFATYLHKSGFNNTDTGTMYPSTGYRDKKDAIHDRNYEIQSDRRDGIEVTEVDYVWR